MFRKIIHKWEIQTRDLVHTFLTSNHYAASVNISVLLLSLTKIIYKNHCTALPRHLAAGVGHPVRAQPRPPHLPGHLTRRALTSEVLVLPVAAAAPASRWHAGSSSFEAALTGSGA